MSSAFDFFDKIYCVNLPESKARKREVSALFRDLGILNRVVFDAAPKPPKEINLLNVKFFTQGVLGCTFSHWKILFNALYAKAENFLVFEDDVILNQTIAQTEHRLSVATQSLPPDWDVLYLGGKPKTAATYYSRNLGKTGHFLGTYAYAMNRKAMPGFMDGMLVHSIKYTCDGILGGFARDHKGFCIFPPLFGTKPGTSMIRNAHRDYTGGTARAWKKLGPKRK